MNKNIVVVIFIGLFLSACSSDFEKCMDTELPKANKIIGLEKDRNTGRELALLQKSAPDVIVFLWEINKFYDENSEWPDGHPPAYGHPYYDKFECTDSCGDIYIREMEKWGATSEGKEWFEKLDAEILRLGQRYESPITDVKSLIKLEVEYHRLITENILPLSTSSYEFFDYYITDENNPIDILNKSINEAIIKNSKTISEKVVMTTQLATVTCNNKGFYK